MRKHTIYCIDRRQKSICWGGKLSEPKACILTQFAALTRLSEVWSLPKSQREFEAINRPQQAASIILSPCETQNIRNRYKRTSAPATADTSINVTFQKRCPLASSFDSREFRFIKVDFIPTDLKKTPSAGPERQAECSPWHASKHMAEFPKAIWRDQVGC